MTVERDYVSCYYSAIRAGDGCGLQSLMTQNAAGYYRLCHWAIDQLMKNISDFDCYINSAKMKWLLAAAKVVEQIGTRYPHSFSESASAGVVLNEVTWNHGDLSGSWRFIDYREQLQKTVAVSYTPPAIVLAKEPERTLQTAIQWISKDNGTRQWTRKVKNNQWSAPQFNRYGLTWRPSRAGSTSSRHNGCCRNGRSSELRWLPLQLPTSRTKQGHALPDWWNSAARLKRMGQRQYNGKMNNGAHRMDSTWTGRCRTTGSLSL